MLASQTALTAAEMFTRQTIDALPSLIAVLDENGVIIAANQSWREFVAAGEGPRIAVEGQSYLRICAQSAAFGDDCAAAYDAALSAVVARTHAKFATQYPFASPPGPSCSRLRL